MRGSCIIYSRAQAQLANFNNGESFRRVMALIVDDKALREFNKNLIRRSKANYKRNLAIYEAMYKEYRMLNKDKNYDPLDGMDFKVKITKILNSV
jgi:hypothetical protein